MGGVTLGIALIAKNEAENLPRLLESIDGAFNRAVLLDTGSTDDTIDVFSAWAREQTGMTFSVASWEWKDDFADARNAADRLLLYGTALPDVSASSRPMVDWKCWADCDDILTGARNLRNVVETADERITAFFAGYDYAQEPSTGQNVIYLRRERLIRATYRHPWVGRVHEAIPITQGAITQMPAEVCEWKHCKRDDDAPESNNRNLRILERWDEDDPHNSRVVAYLGIENMVQGKFKIAAEYFEEYIEQCNPQWDEEHAQVCRKLFQCYMLDGDARRAESIAWDALKVLPSWPDNWLSLAELYFDKGEFSKAAHWAKLVEGVPDTMLIINPNDYTFLPRKVMALALGRLGKVEQAVETAEQALQIFPADELLQRELHNWRSLVKREHTANQYVTMAQQLIAHDEQLKARTLLDCAPVFAIEHPKVVGMRAALGERLQWASNDQDFADHYEHGGSKAEDFIKDDQIDELCEYLPRTQFLLEGIKEQIGAASK